MSDFYLKASVGLDVNQIQDQLDKAGMKTSLKISTQLKNGGLTETTMYMNKYGDSVKAVDGIVKQAKINQKAHNEEIDRLGKNTKVVTKTYDEFGQVVEKTTTLNKNLAQSFVETTAKVAKWYLSTQVIKLFRDSLNEAVETVKKFDEAITEMGKVSDYSGEQLRKYTEELGELGLEVGRTRTEMTEASTEFLKAGFSEEEAKTLARTASLYQNTADEVLSASEATSVLISQMKAFNITAEESIHLTDVINKVSANYAVSSADIGKGLTQAGAALATYGNSFEETVGLIN